MKIMRPVMGFALALFGFFGTGCVSQPPKAKLPYAWPVASQTMTVASTEERPSAVIVLVEDKREDRVLEAFLSEPIPETVKRIVAAELGQTGVFSTLEIRPVSTARPAAVELGIVLEDVSWAVPNYERMVQTAFWTSFLTGGIGGVAYGSTETPVYGRAALSLRATRLADQAVIFEHRAEAVHEEKKAKFSSDTLETRLHMSATALNLAMAQLRKAVEADKAKFSAPAEPAAGASGGVR
jgi:hypothetical protein